MYWYSVKQAMVIGGKKHIPCVCYEGNNLFYETLKELERREKVVFYSNEVSFSNGKVILENEVRADKSSKVKEEIKERKETTVKTQIPPVETVVKKIDERKEQETKETKENKETKEGIEF